MEDRKSLIRLFDNVVRGAYAANAADRSVNVMRLIADEKAMVYPGLPKLDTQMAGDWPDCPALDAFLARRRDLT